MTKILAPLSLMALCAAVTMTAVRAGQSPATAEPKPTSYVLIDRALEAKRIDEETAHKYRVFAAFGDARLPPEYRGAFEQGDRSIEIGRAGARLETFSAATRAALAPYFMRPDEPGSWVTLSGASDPAPLVGNRRSGLLLASYAFVRQQPQPPAPISWRRFPAVGGRVMVWAQDRYAGDAAKAEAIARAMDADKVWARLTGLMRREPVSDVLITPNGGDGALDIYLVRPPLGPPDPNTGQRSSPWAGFAPSARPADSCHPIRYLLLDSRSPLVGNQKTQGLLSSAAHELFHAITFAYQVVEGCETRWIREGTATWAENWIYPAPDSEHDKARDYMRLAWKPIDSLADTYPDYGTYLLPLYLEKISGSADFMRTMWEAFVKLNAPPLSGTVTDRQRAERSRIDRLNTLKGVGAVLDGGWDTSWPRFLVKVWNQAPTDAPQGYKGWDRLTETPITYGGKQSIATPADPVIRTIELPAEQAGSLSGAIMPLAGVFTHFAFEPNVRSVVFVNTIAEVAHEHKSVWGIQKIRGAWKDPEDWTEDFQKAWCRSEAKEDIEELVIVFGNSDSLRLEPVKPEKLPEIKAYPFGCSAWSGTSDAEKTIVSRDPALKIVERVTSNMRFEIDPELEVAGQPREYWKITGGELTWSVTVTGVCTGGGSGKVAITDRGPGEEIATLRVWEDEKILRYSGGTGPWPGDIPTYTIRCPNEPPTQMVLFMALGWWTTDMQNDTVSDNGMTLRGTLTTSQGDATQAITDRISYELRRSP